MSVIKTKNQDAINAAFAAGINELVKDHMPPGMEGWVYRDLRWLTKDTWDMILGEMGADNYAIIVQSQRKFDGVDYFGGQFFVSPQGIQNLLSYLERTKNAQ